MALQEVRLPAGDVAGFDFDYSSGTGNRKLWSSEWLKNGYSGVRIIGAGRSLTHIRPQLGSAWDTIFAVQHAGEVRLESLTVHCANTSAIHFGIEHKLEPKFKLTLRDVAIVADPVPPEEPVRGTWGVFSFNADHDFEDCLFDCAWIKEHPVYQHGYASKRAAAINRCEWMAAGAECYKSRPDPSEILWVKNPRLHFRACKFKNWYQPWSNRGGAAIVMQGSGADGLIELCEFWAPSELYRSRILMVDDGGGRFYDGLTREVGKGFANGHWIIRQCGFSLHRGADDYHGPAIRFGNFDVSAPWRVARSVTIKDCGVWGDHFLAQFSNIPEGKLCVTGCNTPALRNASHAIGMDTGSEVQLPTNPLMPFSAGLQQ